MEAKKEQTTSDQINVTFVVNVKLQKIKCDPPVDIKIDSIWGRNNLIDGMFPLWPRLKHKIYGWVSEVAFWGIG